MKQRKKRLSVILALLVAVAMVISACGGGGGSGNGSAGGGSGGNGGSGSSGDASGGSTSSSSGGSSSDLPPYELSLYYPGTPQKDEKVVEEAINKILKEKINATLDIVPIEWGAWDDRMNLMIASREKADIIFTAQWNGHAVNVGKGAFLELGDLLQKHGQGILETLDPAFLEGAKINGKNYGVPTNKELAAAGGIVYDKKIAEELGLDMSSVKTPQDLTPILEKVKQARPDITPVWTNGGLFNSHFFANYDFLGDGTIPGAILKDFDDTTVRPVEEMDRYKDYLAIAREWHQKGYINKDAATTLQSSSDIWQARGTFLTVEPMKPGKAEEIAAAAGRSGELEQIIMTAKTVATSETAGSMLAISSTSEDPERAMMFINLLHTDKELNNLLNFGIEGVHYTRNGEIISPTDRTGDYSPGSAWMFGSQFLNYIWDSEDPEKWNKFREFNQNAHVSPGLGFVFNSDPVKSEVGALANVIEQYQRALETGSVDPDKVLPEYLGALKAAGLDKVVAEKQRQFDEFLASK
jgi:putative aldouronate transport system substrate-binding protein